jgi:hypothetical protein
MHLCLFLKWTRKEIYIYKFVIFFVFDDVIIIYATLFYFIFLFGFQFTTKDEKLLQVLLFISKMWRLGVPSMFFCLLYSKKNGVHFVYKSTCEMLLIMTKDLGGMKILVLTNVWFFLCLNIWILVWKVKLK